MKITRFPRTVDKSDRMRIFLCSLIAAISVPAWGDSAGTSLLHSLTSFLSLTPHEEVVTSIEKKGERVLSCAPGSPWARTCGSVGEMLETMRIPADAPGKPQVILIDSMVPNAFYLPHKGQEFIGVSLGLLAFAESDDEIYYAFRHERNHPLSQLQELIDSNRAKGERSARSIFYSHARQRAVEAEVDFKSVILGLHEKGFNPHAALHFANRMMELQGSGFSLTHPDWQSRRDVAMEGAISFLERGRGERVKEDKPQLYQRKYVAQFRRDFANDQFIADRIAHLKTALAPTQDEVNSVIEDWFKGGTHTLKDYREAWIEQALTEIRDSLGFKLTPAVYVDLQIGFQKQLEAQFLSAIRSIVEPKSRNLTVRQFSQLNHLFSELQDLAKWGTYRGGNLTDGLFKTVESGRKIKAELGQQRVALKGASTPSERMKRIDRIRELESDLRKEQLTHEYLLSAFEPEARSVINRFTRTNRASTFAKLEKLERLPYHGSSEGRTLTESLLRSNLPDIMGRHLDEMSCFDLLELLYKYSYSDFRTHAEAIYTNAVDDLARRGGSIQTFIDYGKHESVFKAFQEVDPQAAERILDRALTSEIQAAETLVDLNRALGRRRNLGASNLLALYERLDDIALKVAQKVLQSTPAEIANLPSAATSLSNYLKDYEKFTRFYGPDPRLLMNPAQATQFQRKLFRISIEGEVKRRATPRASPSPSQEAALLFINNPSLKRMFDPEDNYTINRCISELKTLSSIKALHKTHERVIFFADLIDNLAKVMDLQSPQFMETLYQLRHLTLYTDNLESAVELKDIERFFDVLKSYQDWVKIHHPKDFSLRTIIHSPQGLNGSGWHDSQKAPIVERTVGYFRERFNDYFRASGPGLSYSERVQSATVQVWKALDRWRTHGTGISDGDLRKCLEALAPANPAEQLQFFTAYHEGLVELEKSKRTKDGRTYSTTDISDHHLLQQAAENATLANCPDRTTLIRAYEYLTKGSASPRAADHLFHLLTSIRDTDPIVGEWFLNPTLIETRQFDEEKMELARWQLEKKFALSRKRRIPTPARERKELAAILEFVQKQFPKFSAVRNEILTHVENSLLTNDTETSKTNALRISEKNWYESESVVAVDLPHQLNQYLNNNERIEWIEYFLGRTNQMPKSLRKIGNTSSIRMQAGAQEELARKARRYFLEADPIVRAFALVPMLDEQNGLLSTPEGTEHVLEMLLGPRATNPVMWRGAELYRKSANAADAKNYLAYSLGLLAGSSGSHRISYAKLLEGSGEFGIKFGQAIRGSGRATAEVNADLDHLYDSAFPPDRPTIMRSLKGAFGDRFYDLDVKGISGSGSINWTVKANFWPEGRGQGKRSIAIVIRVQRDGVGPRIRAENSRVSGTIQLMEQEPDPKLVESGRILDEIRRVTMTGLHEDGVELDHEKSRAAYEWARRHYDRPRDADHEFEIKTVGPLAAVQALIQPEYSKRVSVFEEISFVPWNEIKDKRLKEAGASEALEVEYEGAFKGAGDFDGTPGNWLMDPVKKILYRIDYDHARGPSRDAVFVHDILSILFLPQIPKREAAIFAHSFQKLSNLKAASPTVIKAVEGAFSNPLFPEFNDPYGRFNFIRTRIETALTPSGMPKALIEIKDTLGKSLASFLKNGTLGEMSGAHNQLRVLLKAMNVTPEDYFAGNLKKARAIRRAVECF